MPGAEKMVATKASGGKLRKNPSQCLGVEIAKIQNQSLRPRNRVPRWPVGGQTLEISLNLASDVQIGQQKFVGIMSSNR